MKTFKFIPIAALAALTLLLAAAPPTQPAPARVRGWRDWRGPPQHSTSLDTGLRDTEELGRLTFTNGRTGGPTIDADLVLVRGITGNWGGEGAAMDRFYAFDKRTGQEVWSASPGAPPKDNSFARPYLTWREGKRVLYT